MRIDEIENTMLTIETTGQQHAGAAGRAATVHSCGHLLLNSWTTLCQNSRRVKHGRPDAKSPEANNSKARTKETSSSTNKSNQAQCKHYNSSYNIR